MTDRDKMLPIGIVGSAPALGKAQKRFNMLIRKIEAQRQLLAEWRDVEPVFSRRHAAEMEPLYTRLQERRRAMVLLLDRQIGNRALTKKERAAAHDLLLSQIEQLLGETEDTELAAIFERHAGVTYAQAREEEHDLVESIASSVFGVELEPGHGARTPEELAGLIGEKMQADAAARASAPRRKKSARTQAKEALREQARHDASRSLREIYRALASALHPDRETDAAERARKTALMQEANQAYEARDLLALLELQLKVEQIDAGALARLAQERVEHFNLVLEEQLARLQEELDDITEPFRMTVGASTPRDFTPKSVLTAFDRDLSGVREMLAGIEADLLRFEDVKALKRDLRQLGTDRGDAYELDMLAAMLMQGGQRPRRR